MGETERIFNGKVYKSIKEGIKDLDSAKSVAAEYRKKGYLARVVPNSVGRVCFLTYYSVYVVKK